MERVLRLNTVGPALVAKHFLPLLAPDRKAVFDQRTCCAVGPNEAVRDIECIDESGASRMHVERGDPAQSEPALQIRHGQNWRFSIEAAQNIDRALDGSHTLDRLGAQTNLPCVRVMDTMYNLY